MLHLGLLVFLFHEKCTLYSKQKKIIHLISFTYILVRIMIFTAVKQQNGYMDIKICMWIEGSPALQHINSISVVVLFLFYHMNLFRIVGEVLDKEKKAKSV